MPAYGINVQFRTPDETEMEVVIWDSLSLAEGMSIAIKAEGGEIYGPFPIQAEKISDAGEDIISIIRGSTHAKPIHRYENDTGEYRIIYPLDGSRAILEKVKERFGNNL